MRILFLLFLISLFYCTVSSQSRMTDREFAGLRGKVKSVFTEDADLVLDKGKLVPKFREMQFDELYDEAGNMTQSSIYFVGSRRIFTFIDNEKTSKSANFQTSRASVAVIAGSKAGNNVPVNVPYELKYKYEYDTNGRIIKETIHRYDGTLYTKTDYKYNDQGKLIEEIWYQGDKVSKNLYYTYDAKGNLTEQRFVPTGINGETDPSTYLFKDYKFDKQGNWVQRNQTTIYTSNGQVNKPQRIVYSKIAYYK